jgi:pimeloyl-ACP methyl ester carboxylesterase
MAATALLSAGALTGLYATSAAAEIAYTPCKENNDFACAHLSVPLDPTGAVAGTVSLSLRRHRAPIGEGRSAIIALAGGPGQAALPFAEEFTSVLGPVAATRDVIVYDQRGVGQSNPLSCHVFERSGGGASSLQQAVSTCAAEIGVNRAFFTTADTVADIEAIRKAGGYEKLVLYGTSYGTKVAEEYAEAYPEHVEALVLDSVVPPNGPDSLARSTFQAIPRVLSQLCAGRLCAHVTSHPVTDLRRVLARIEDAPLRPRILLAHGTSRRVTVSAEGLLDILLAGDFSDLLRAQLVTSLSAASHGDDAPIARLVGTLESGSEAEEDFDLPLYYSTICEEETFPWNRASTPSARLAEALTAAHSLPAADFAPFSASDALGFGDADACSGWPFASSAPAPQQELPDVPTLIFSGADDLRTPTANAQEVASAIPDAKLVVVPYTGHSVLSAEPGSCGIQALKAFFAQHAIAACRKAPPPTLLRPAAVPPKSLSDVRTARGYEGTPGRTLEAVKLTLKDLGSQLALHLDSLGLEEFLASPTVDLGGLRTGWMSFQASGLAFHDYSFVPGVSLSGSLKDETAALVIAGTAAAHGTLRIGAHHSLVGELGGQSVRIPQASVAEAAIVGADASASETINPRGTRRVDVPGWLSGLLGRLFGA